MFWARIALDIALLVCTAVIVRRSPYLFSRLRIKFTLSTDAGGYLCNEAFYALMRRKVECAGFVHVPVARPGTPELEELKRAGRAIVEACIEAAAR